MPKIGDTKEVNGVRFQYVGYGEWEKVSDILASRVSIHDSPDNYEGKEAEQVFEEIDGTTTGLREDVDYLLENVDQDVTEGSSPIFDGTNFTNIPDSALAEEYSLTDGSRPFTNPVGGVTPISGSDLATKDYVDEAVTEVIYVPNTLTLTTGTYTSGNVASVQTLSDSDYYILQEVAGVPGFDVRFNFIDVEHINRIWLHVHYDGNFAHIVNVDLWNYDTSSWDTQTSFTVSGSLQFIEIKLVSDADYIDISGNAIVRIYHISSGNASHNIEIDYVALTKTGYGSSNDHGSLVGLMDDDHPQYYNEERLNAWDYAEALVTLTSDGWSTNEQSETIAGLTATSDVIVYPPVDRTDYLAYGAAQISATAVGTDSITFTCTTEPVVDIENIIVRWR